MPVNGKNKKGPLGLFQAASMDGLKDGHGYQDVIVFLKLCFEPLRTFGV